MIHCIGWTARRFSGRVLAGAGIMLVGILPAGCASLKNTDHLVRSGATAVTNLPGWRQESAAGLRDALGAQCRLARLGQPWPRLCATLTSLPDVNSRHSQASASKRSISAHVPDTRLKDWVRKHFEAWQLTNPSGAGSGLLTGYYEPLLTGSLWPEHSQQIPLYAKPAQLIPGDPAWTRREIEAGDAGQRLRGHELLWLDDPVAAFFLHIQGSGRVRLRDGRIVRVGFAGHNGHPYFAVGRELIRTGAIARASMSADRIRQWMHANPQAGEQLRWRNPRYIFFKLVGGLADTSGPAGSLQVPLTSFRSVATDERFVPAGALLYLDTRLPVHKPTRVGLTLTQDTGGAIRGPVRADLFTGSGHSAGQLAGRLRQPMRMWLLWPKGQTPPARIPVARRVINP